MKSIRLIAVVFSCVAALSPALSLADQMSWTITSEYEYRIQVEFYSQNRNSAWPGGTKAYYVNDYAPHTYYLSCIRGEKICYGAWPTGGDGSGNYSTYWGAGLDGRQSCRNCCGICGADNPNTRLVGDQ